jgi:hypothetical protein
VILPGHVRWFEAIFGIDGFFGEPVVTFGFHEIALGKAGHPVPDAYKADNLAQLLANRGLKDTHVLDYFDSRADLRYDMNQPVPSSEYDRYGTFVDIGSLEHLFDARQCLENCLRMVKVGGFYFLHTPVRGYFLHGFHTFHPEALTQALTLNGFEIVFVRYSSADGTPIDDPGAASDVLIWLVGRKTRRIAEFVSPQQGCWQTTYLTAPVERGWRTSALQRAKRMVSPWLPPIVADGYRRARAFTATRDPGLPPL